MKIWFKETGKYMIYIVVDGIESNYGGTINVELPVVSLQDKAIN